MSSLPESVVITDDTMREGLQIESADIPVSEKLRLLDALGETGAKVISIGSFAHPKWTPQMACIDEIAERFVPKPEELVVLKVASELNTALQKQLRENECRNAGQTDRAVKAIGDELAAE